MNRKKIWARSEEYGRTTPMTAKNSTRPEPALLRCGPATLQTCKGIHLVHQKEPGKLFMQPRKTWIQGKKDSLRVRSNLIQFRLIVVV